MASTIAKPEREYRPISTILELSSRGSLSVSRQLFWPERNRQRINVLTGEVHGVEHFDGVVRIDLDRYQLRSNSKCKRPKSSRIPRETV
jgi:hypothetical protein